MPLSTHHPCGLALDEPGLSVNTIVLWLVRTNIPRGMRRHVLLSCSVPLPVRSCVAWPGLSALTALMGFSLRRFGPVRGWRDVSIPPRPPAFGLQNCPPGDFCRGSLGLFLMHPLAESGDQGHIETWLLGFRPAGKCAVPAVLRRRRITVLPWALPLSGLSGTCLCNRRGLDTASDHQPPEPPHHLTAAGTCDSYPLVGLGRPFPPTSRVTCAGCPSVVTCRLRRCCSAYVAVPSAY